MSTKQFSVNERLKLTSKQVRVCIFVRVSREKQEFARQLDELNAYAQQRGFIVVKTIATKISGMKRADERNDIQELLELAGKKTFDMVLVTELSRLGRTSKTI